MSGERNKTIELRTYLLGETSSVSRREEIERQLLVDDDYFGNLSLQEDLLIQDYVDDELNRAERQLFERNFLITEQRREAVKFARLLRKYVNTRKTQTQTAEVKKENSGWKHSLQNLLTALSSPLPIGAICLVLIACVSFLVWNFYPRHSSDNQMATVLLNKAYERNRPLESRITELSYAPFALNRGATESNFDLQELNEAEHTASSAEKAASTAANLHSLARVYLAKKEFGEAVKRLEEAQRKEPQNAGILSDLGTAYLEQGKTFEQKNESAKSLEMSAKALENFEKAIEIEPNSLEARFNKAIAVQSLKNPNQAREAWQDYLKFDATSQWADEARQNLKLLDLNKSQNKTAEEILQSFLTTFRNKDDENAYKTESRNREMITGKLIPQQLAFLFLETDGENQAEYLSALQYAGRLNRLKTGDAYFDELAKFYSSLPEEKQNDLQRAQISVRSGYRLSLETKRREALDQFSAAQEIFRQNGDVWEADLCDYWIGYLLFQTNKLEDSARVLNDLVERSARYKWLTSHAFFVLTTNMIASNEFSKALEFNRKALTLAEETDDLYNTQKTLSQRAEIYRRIGDFRRALDFTGKNLQINAEPEVSLRQKWRDLDLAASLFAAMKFYKTSASFEKEALNLAEQLHDNTFNYQANVNLGLIYGAQENYEKAFEFFEKGRQIAEQFPDAPLKNKIRANTNLFTANIQRESKNCREAIVSYDEALKFYDYEEFQTNQYDAHKGRLLCYIENGDDAAIQAELPVILNLFRDYRAKILEEQNRNSFFDNKQSIYDVAINYEFERSEFETAFDYSEESRARSLLDLQKSSAVVEVSRNDSIPEIKFSPNVSEPLKLVQIQAEMPENVQLLQYSVLNDKTLVWLITKNNFTVVKTDISASDLQEKASTYIELVTKNDVSESKREIDLAKELYRILIAPIADKLDDGKQISLIPDKILFRLPFAALVSPQNEKRLIAERTIFYSPSANIFLNCSKKAKESESIQTETLLSIGNPAFNQKDFPSLPDLSWASAEAKEIAKFYDRKVLLIDKAATKGKINEALPKANVVHFAGHYVVDEHSPMLSSLILAENEENADSKNSVLTNSDIVGGKLSNVRLIVLSACDTGVEGYFGGEGMIGAARTFLATGVPLVVASQWSVDSNATAELMINFHRYRATRKLSTVEALRRAQLDLLEGENKSFRNPFYWAAFTALGGYSAI